MRRALGLALAAGVSVAIACSSHGPKYPACQHDDQCAVGGRHDYCVDGKCAYCRTSIDCGARQRCRSGACETDPDAPPLPEAGTEAGGDAGKAEDEAGEGDDDDAVIDSQELEGPRPEPMRPRPHLTVPSRP
jgi:hypothetical protein